MKLRHLIALTLAGLLGACSGGAGQSGGPLPGGMSPDGSGPAGVVAPAAGGTTILKLRMIVPKASASRAHYVSPATLSIVVQEGAKKLGTFDTVAKAKGCVVRKVGTVCTFRMAAMPGKSRLLGIKSYSARKGRGALLARATVVRTILAGKVNALAVTLDGVVAAIAVSLQNAHPVTGSSASIPVYVTATDASGATIVGPGTYVPPIVLHDSDSSGATALSTTRVLRPSTAVTLAYNGSSALASATISASARGIPASKITAATLTPTTLAGVTESGAAAFAVVSDSSGNAVAFVPAGAGLASVVVAAGGVLQSSRSKAQVTRATTTPAPLPITPVPDECAPDLVHAQLYCMSFSSNVVSIVSYNPSNVLAPPTLAGQVTTDAPTAGVSFSGATCIICGIAFDPKDDAYIVATANGYELWSTSPGATAPLKTLPAPISENFGYNAITDQIFSAWYGNDTFDATPAYSGLDVIDVASGNRYTLDDPSLSPSYPDAGAVDTKTNIAFAPEENSLPVYLVNLNAPPDTFVAPTPLPSPLPTGIPPYAVGSYSSPVVAATPPSTLITNCDETYTAADSVEDLGFFGSEFCSQDYVAVGALPTSPSGTLNFSNYVAAELPNTPDGAFISPQDPHAVLVMNLPGVCADCGVLYNYDKSYLAIVDLNKLLALNPAGSGEYDVPTTNPLTGIVTYLATGLSSPPSAFGRALAAHAHHRRR